jgi:ABC-2 type transport system permease protein
MSTGVLTEMTTATTAPARRAPGPRPLLDATTMLRRNLRRMIRYPSLTLFLVGIPIVFMLLFTYVFGGTLGAGIGGGPYIDYMTPGILLITVGAASTGTAISVAMDRTEGIMDRFRTMAISRSSVLTGHVVGSVIQFALAVVVVFGVAVLIGFRPTTGPLSWLAALGLLVVVCFALTWLSVAMGLVSNTVEAASNLPMPLTFLPFLSSGFVPTDSMPAGLRWFTGYQPFTPITDTLRGLLLGAPIGASWIAALAWSAGIALVGYLWARRLFTKGRAR